MRISTKSLELLRIAYSYIDDDSTSTRVEISVPCLAQRLEITDANTLICIGYLEEKQYVKSVSTRGNGAAPRELIITAAGIDAVENGN